MQHGGNIYAFAQQIGCFPEQVLDFSANINPEQAVDWRQLPDIKLTPYAEPNYALLKQALLKRYPTPAHADIEIFNGASAAIFALLRYLQPKDLILYAPLYVEYAKAGEQLGCKIHHISRFDNSSLTDIPKDSTVIFVNPATPDGTLYEMPELLAQWQANNCTIIVDESFLDFCRATSVMSELESCNNLYVIKSLSKFYGCAGVRIGFIAASASAINSLRHFEPAWKLSSFDMAYIQQALANTGFIEQTRAQTLLMRELLFSVLKNSNLFDLIYPSQANFLLARLAQSDGYSLQKRLEKAGILIRVCDNFTGLDQRYVRFAVKSHSDIMQLAEALQHV